MIAAQDKGEDGIEISGYCWKNEATEKDKRGESLSPVGRYLEDL